MLLILFLFTCCYGLHLPVNLLVLLDTSFTDVNFYEQVPKDEWDALDINKKRGALDDFLKTELCVYDAQKQGLFLHPKTKKNLLVRKKQLLLNNTYEHLIARPFVSALEVEKNLNNLQYKVEGYHLLIGYLGSQQNTESTLSKEEAYVLIDSLYYVIKKEGLSRPLLEVFEEFAFKYSIDPSAKTNRGFLGWVPWGRTVMSFQEPLFNLPDNSLSSPIHTEYGYHLIFKGTVARSSYYYYSEKNYKDLAYKVGQRSLSFDSLRVKSSLFDSLTIKGAGFVFHKKNMGILFDFLLEKQEEQRLMGNKNQLLEWLGEGQLKNQLLFIVNKKGFGVGWLINKLKEAPSSRIPVLKTKESFNSLVLSFVLQDLVLELANTKNIQKKTSFKRDWKNNYKNIVYNDYLSFLLNKLSPLDSSVVLKKYKEGLLDKSFFRPLRVVFSEIRVFDSIVASSVLDKIKKGVAFDALLVDFGGGIKEPVSISAHSELSRVAFGLLPGDVSNIIQNKDGSFSIIQIERFLEEEPFSLSLVYDQLERKLVTLKQDSLKTFLLEDLIKKHKGLVSFSVVGL